MIIEAGPVALHLRPDTRHGPHSGGARPRLDEAALRAEAEAIRAKPFRSARDSKRMRAIRSSLASIENRSPYKEAM